MVLRTLAAMLLVATVAALAAGLCGACAAPGPRLSALPLDELPSRAPVTVLVFFAPHCHCLMAHDARLVALYERYRTRGVQLFMVDSEASATTERDQAEAKARGYPFPILLDRGARIANQLGADYATYTVVLDAAGNVRYRGGIDSDEMTLHDDATPYVQDAIEALLAGRAPRVTYAKALGCSLQKW
jgi:hypothetical protein